MRTKRIIFGFLILALMACNFVTQLIAPPTATPQPTATLTASPTLMPTFTATPLVPAYVPPHCANQPLATVAPHVALAQPTPEVHSNPGVSKTEQLQIFRDMTHIIEEVYVYPDYNGKDWNEIKARYKSKIEVGLDTESFYQEMRSMVYELGDEHSDYLSPIEVEGQDAKLQGETDYVGVGIYGEYNFEKQTFVVFSTIPGSAAEYAGLQSHDSILSVDGLPITEELGNRLRGPECSVAVAKVQSPGEAPRDVMLMRYRIDGEIPLEARLVSTTDSSKIGYIFLPSFFDQTLLPQMEQALDQFGELDGLILDLRLNGGGISTIAYPIMSFFTDGQLGAFVSRKESRPLEIEADPIQNSQTVPLTILVGEETASFGEIFAGIMQDSGRAKVVGQTSLGNVEVLNQYRFDDGSILWIASEMFDSAFSDENWEQNGIIPNVEAYADWDTFYFDTDPAILASLELLGHR
ncbi:MAG TPA: S41 family peptidase [Anaerolineales bacterium]|nr:S41 family peptidase [Anaerolineales bacterium]